jgi:hypothetical protein
LLVIGFPVGAFAVSGSNTFVTDSTTGAHAKVSSTGSLQTSVTGTVSATALPPLGSFVKMAVGSSTPVCGFLTPPEGKALVITAVDQVPTNASVESNAQLNVLVDTSSDCDGTQTSIANGLFSQLQPRELTFNPGIGLKSGQHLDLYSSGGGFVGYVYVYGYIVPAADCATGCL